MKDGIYSVKVNFRGEVIVAKAEVKNGIFRGLGNFRHLTGSFKTLSATEKASIATFHHKLMKVDRVEGPTDGRIDLAPAKKAVGRLRVTTTKVARKVSAETTRAVAAPDKIAKKGAAKPSVGMAAKTLAKRSQRQRSPRVAPQADTGKALFD